MSAADRLRDAHACAVAIDPTDIDEKRWAIAIDALIDESALDVVEWSIAGLTAHFPRSRYFPQIAGLFEQLPPPAADPAFAAFRDDAAADAQLVPYAGSDTLVIGLCGTSHRMMVALPLVHRWFGAAGASVLYLRDRQACFYDRGVSTFGGSYADLVSGVSRMIAALGPRRVVVQGHSSGAYAALRLGLDLRADVVLAFGAVTHKPVDPIDGTDILRDLHLDYAAAGRSAPAAHLIYGDLNLRDQTHAAHMAGLPTVTLCPVAGEKLHAMMVPMLRNGAYAALLATVLAADLPQAAAA